MQTIVASIIFGLTYLIIISERLHRTTAALVGGMLMILLGILSQEEAFHAVDLNVIFLLAGMMMIAYLIGQTGVFQWMAVKAVRMGQGNPMIIMIIISLITAATSALLDNVTVVVLIAPVTLFVASNLGLSPVPFLIAEVMASNIGGAATLIGDPPNILIASAGNIDFVNFAIHMAPPTMIVLAVFMLVIWLLFRRQLTVSPEHRQAILRLESRGLVRDPVLLTQTLIVLGLVILGFLFQGILKLEPATIALSGATLLLVWTRRDPLEILEHVEWTTLIFFVGLFITVEAVVKVGIVAEAAHALLRFTSGKPEATIIFLLWFSAISSGIVDNIPYTATMIPLVENLGEVMPIGPLWWALALGADLGGNLTLVGASANVVVASLAERSGYRLSFGEFLRYGTLTVIVSLILSTIWLWLVYL